MMTAPIDYTQHLDEWGRPHADDDCWECRGCSDPACLHSEAGECQRIGCECMALIADGDPLCESQPCRACDGYGEIVVEHQSRNPELETTVHCWACLGSGVHHPVEDAS